MCKKLAEKLGFNHLNVGELLCESANKGDKVGKEIQDLMVTGKLVSSELVVEILDK